MTGKNRRFCDVRNLSEDVAAKLKTLLQRERLESYLQVATTELLLPQP